MFANAETRMQWLVMLTGVEGYKRVAMVQVVALVADAESKGDAAAGIVSLGVLVLVTRVARVSLVVQ